MDVCDHLREGDEDGVAAPEFDFGSSLGPARGETGQHTVELSETDASRWHVFMPHIITSRVLLQRGSRPGGMLLSPLQLPGHRLCFLAACNRRPRARLATSLEKWTTDPRGAQVGVTGISFFTIMATLSTSFALKNIRYRALDDQSSSRTRH